MEYELYLKYDQTMALGPARHWGALCEHNWASIMHWTGKDDADINNEEDEGTQIGTIKWVTYNQVLAMVHGVNMTHIPFLSLQINGKAILELDYTRISQETIDEIGTASTPNIVMILHFGIQAPWRNKGTGEQVLKRFIEHMKGKYGYIVILNNKPAQFAPDAKRLLELDKLEQDPEKAQYKLNAFWQRCGFKPFKNYDNVFICNVDQAVPHLVAQSASQLA